MIKTKRSEHNLHPIKDDVVYTNMLSKNVQFALNSIRFKVKMAYETMSYDARA